MKQLADLIEIHNIESHKEREHLNELALNMLTTKYIKQQIGKKRVNFTLTIGERVYFAKIVI